MFESLPEYEAISFPTHRRRGTKTEWKPVIASHTFTWKHWGGSAYKEGWNSLDELETAEKGLLPHEGAVVPDKVLLIVAFVKIFFKYRFHGNMPAYIYAFRQIDARQINSLQISIYI